MSCTRTVYAHMLQGRARAAPKRARNQLLTRNVCARDSSLDALQRADMFRKSEPSAVWAILRLTRQWLKRTYSCENARTSRRFIQVLVVDRQSGAVEGLLAQ